MEYQAVVIIPIYKSLPNETEDISFRNNIHVLSKHKISILTHTQLDISYYTRILDREGINFQIDYFDKNYFDSLASYNRLLLSEDFYKQYVGFDYMLITQLDVYVFRDELEMWCSRGYDYIGAPWFDRFRSSHDHAKLKKVGNGGFSLRKVRAYIYALEYAKSHNKTISIFNFWNQYEFFECHKFSFENVWKRVRGIDNNLQYYLKSSIQEDVIWSQIVPEAIKSFKVAPLKEAIKFSFECDPAYLYELNNKQLPFGCHAWHKNQYNEFWSEYIK